MSWKHQAANPTRHSSRFKPSWTWGICAAFLWACGTVSAQPAGTDQPPNAVDEQPTVSDLARQAQRRVVKIYGAGGLRGLEEYQSGFLVSPFGHVATAWSYVLDVEPYVVLDDGRRYEGKIVGFEPALELAVLKIEDDSLEYFEMPAEELQTELGDPVLAISNLFGVATGNEPASVMQGTVAALTKLDAGRGTLKTPYRGDVILLDLIANNPGAAGGALVNVQGDLIGMLGKELRDSETGVWLNYAVPTSAIRTAISDIIAGRETTVPDPTEPKLARDQSHDFQTLGLVLVPDVLEKTPAYVDVVLTGTPAANASVQPDDLILLVEGKRVDGQAALRELLRRIDRRDDVTMTVQRGSKILPLTLRAGNQSSRLTPGIRRVP